MSQTFAIVESGKVVNIALSETALADNWVQSEVAQIGWDYDGATFTPPPESVPTADQVRAQRNDLLTASDWTQVADAPVDQAAWAAYRQALRDVPEQEGFPANVVWPTKPE